MIRILTSREMSSVSSALRCVLDKIEVAADKRKKVCLLFFNIQFVNQMLYFLQRGRKITCIVAIIINIQDVLTHSRVSVYTCTCKMYYIDNLSILMFSGFFFNGLRFVQALLSINDKKGKTVHVQTLSGPNQLELDINIFSSVT